MLQSHCTVGPSRRLRRTPVAPVERILGGPGVISVGPVVPGLVPVSSRMETSRKTQVLPECSRCLPGVLPVFPEELGPPRYGAGVVQEDPGCTCITEPPWAHRGRRGVLFIFFRHGLYFYISNSIHIKSNQIYLHNKIINIVWQNGMHLHVLKTYHNSHITNT